MTGDRSLKDELARLDIHVLSAGVLLQVGLMPLVLYGEIASRTLPPALLAVTFGPEAIFVLLPVIKLSRGRRRILQLWLSFRLTHAMHGVLCGPD
jgi:hypothetical protein